MYIIYLSQIFMHGTTNIAYSPINSHTPHISTPTIRRKITNHQIQPINSSYNSPKPYQISSYPHTNSGSCYRENFKSPPQVKQFQTSNKNVIKRQINFLQKQEALKASTTLKKNNHQGLTPKYIGNNHKRNQPQMNHLSPKPNFYQPNKVKDNRLFQKQLNNVKTDKCGFKKASNYFYSASNLQLPERKISYSTILSPQSIQNQQSIFKQDNKTIQNLQDHNRLKKQNQTFIQNQKTPQDQLFSTYHSSKRTSQNLEEDRKNSNKHISFNSPKNFKVQNQLVLKPRLLAKSHICAQNQLNKSTKVPKDFQKNKSNIFSEKINKMNFSQNICIQRSTSFTATQKRPPQISNIKLNKKLSVQNSASQPQFVKKQKVYQIKDFMDDIKQNGQNGIQQQDSFCLRNWSIQDFEITQKIGKGSYGNIFLARQKQSKIICVLKCLSKKKIKQQGLQQHVMRQIKIQSYLNHPHIAPLYGFFDDKQKIYLILEYQYDGSLLDNKKKRTQIEVSDILRQICSGLAYLHRQKIIHRDIKPENILMNQNYCKVSDLGCAVFSDSLRSTLVGCLAYISPEQLDQKPYDDKIDSWCIGIMTYELLVGKSPYQEHFRKKIVSNQQVKQFPLLEYPQNAKLSSQAKDFIQKLLNHDPFCRISIRDALKHKFITKSIQLKPKILQ